MSIESKIQEFLKSSAGKKKIKLSLKSISKSTGVTASGQKVASEKLANEFANELGQMFKEEAEACGVPDSVLTDMTPVIQIQKDTEDVFKAVISFKGGAGVGNNRAGKPLFRPSLYPESPDYDGLDNIIAFYNNSGKTPSNYTYGWWDGHNQGHDKYLDMRNPVGSNNGFVWIRSRRWSPAYGFMAAAKEKFLSKHPGYQLDIILGDDYDS